MAYSALPKPGSPQGPCAKPCGHGDCGQTRQDAETPCGGCAKPIGYERAFTRYDAKGDGVRAMWHFACAQDDAEKQRPKAEG